MTIRMIIDTNDGIAHPTGLYNSVFSASIVRDFQVKKYSTVISHQSSVISQLLTRIDDAEAITRINSCNSENLAGLKTIKGTSPSDGQI